LFLASATVCELLATWKMSVNDTTTFSSFWWRREDEPGKSKATGVSLSTISPGDCYRRQRQRGNANKEEEKKRDTENDFSFLF
jgi:hypothetical protein